MFPFLSICTAIFSVASSSLVQREAQVSNIRLFPVSFNLPNPTSSTGLPVNTLLAESTSPFNVSSKDSNPLNSTQPICEPDFGHGLTFESCAQARLQLTGYLNGLSRPIVSIGHQGRGVWDIYDHMKFLDSDRVCAYDVAVVPNGEDRITASHLAYDSNDLMIQCVTRAGGPQAGVVTNIGYQEKVVLAVQYEQPLPNLQCSHDPLPIGPPLASCFALRNIMPKSGYEQTFGRDFAVVDVLLPYTFVGGDGRCTLTIDTVGPADRLLWYTIYKAATEIEVACVRLGQRGVISGLGRDGNLAVMLSLPGQASPGLAVNSSGNYSTS